MHQKVLALALSSSVLSGASFADTTITSNQIIVKANVASACVFMLPDLSNPWYVGAASNAFGPTLDFGTLTPDPGAFSIETPSPATAIVRCTKGTFFSAATDSANYKMAYDGNFIPYTTTVAPMSGVGLGMGVNNAAFGNIPISVKATVSGAAYDVPPGLYQDTTLTLKITY